MIENVKRILVPVDASPVAEAAGEYAMQLAHAMQASVTLLNVYPVPSAMSAIVPGANSAQDLERYRRGAELLVAALANRLERNGTTITTKVEPGAPVATILREATHHDLIVMGTHGRHGLDRWVMGSVAEGVLKGAPCPVITVHIPSH